MMKYICISLFCLLGCMMHISAQSTLVFNQVKLVGAQETIPAGKVWKVESAMASSNLAINTGTTSFQSNQTVILVNGSTVYIKSTWGSSYGTSTLEVTDLPIWLPEGTTLQAGTGTFKISVVEFNVVPNP